MTKCFVLGIDDRARQIATLLKSSDVPSMGFVGVRDSSEFLEVCADAPELRVVGFFCNDLQDEHLSFLGALRNSFGEKVHLHVLFETQLDRAVAKERFKDVADTVFCEYPITSFAAAASIKQRWFPGAPTQKMAKAQKISLARGASRKSHVVETYDRGAQKKEDKIGGLNWIPRVPVVQPLSPIEHEHRAPEVVKKISRDEKHVEQILVPSFLDESVESQATLSYMLRSIAKNSQLPKVPVPVSVVGKGGSVIEVDPRRIKPLSENPRSATNPGFSEESLGELALSMKTIGQLEEALVCPIKDDPEFDAQLIDGERRHRAAIKAGIMLRVTVREDITPDMRNEAYLVSVVRNTDKQPHTTREYMEIVKVLRSAAFGMTLAQVATLLGKSSTWVIQHEYLNRLSPEVKDMLDEPQRGETKQGNGAEGGGKKLTSQIALLLVDIAPEEQQAVVNSILEQQMSYVQARRHVLGVRRGLGLQSAPNKKVRHAEQFQSLATLTRRSIESFGIFLDMPTPEILLLLSGRTKGERNGLVVDLRELADNLTTLISRVELKE